MSNITPTVAAADATLAIANARLDDVTAARLEAEQALNAARKARQAMLDNLAIGTGRATTPDDLAAADAAVTTAGRQHEIMVAVATAGQRAVEQAAIDRLHAEAAAINAAAHASYARIREAAAAADAALAAARDALAEIKQRANDLGAVHQHWRTFTSTVKDAARANRTLAAMTPDRWPAAAAVVLGPLELRNITIEATVVSFGEASVLNKSLALIVCGPIPSA